ncbi:hypothetical protein BV22DRAFT_1103021 [Leucogyrophana mollusca]|uniref:Uncharacterized protein n=1 Tax=Leucogyrophana mollusca TaxID=85980 RepID=A0ACB8BS85_9AGAM|nr:hypothetical protein BV22DRAFT_1103021 [Leucogyrophana mollusca]
MSSPLVAFILGAGPGVGQAVASHLKLQGYKVAVGSRNPDLNARKEDGFLPVQVDVGKEESIQRAFDTVRKELGPPSVVVYNAVSFTPPPTPYDPLSLPLEIFQRDAQLGLGIFTAAQEFISGVRSAKLDAPKAFITTGNVLPFIPPVFSQAIGIGIQKVTEAYLTDLFARAYNKEGIRFYFATETSAEGGYPGPISGPGHAQAYWDLIQRKEQGKYDYR